MVGFKLDRLSVIPGTAISEDAKFNLSVDNMCPVRHRDAPIASDLGCCDKLYYSE